MPSTYMCWAERNINMSGYVHLHLHSEYSLLDGACKIKELVEFADKLGQKAVAITDHGVMYGVIEFYKACLENGIKPIIGCEVYVAPRSRFDKVHKIDTSPYHLILLCENNIGYQNLIKLVSKGFIDGFYNRPRIDRELLKSHSEGLIALSACLGGEIPKKLLEGDYNAAVEAAQFYKETFGENNFYIELQNHGLKKQLEILPNLIKIAKEQNIPLVATNDTHYLEKADSKMQEVLICIQTNHVVGEDGALEFETNEFYFKSEEEMGALFGKIPDALENTVKIAQRCNVEFEFGVTKLPFFESPDGVDNDVYFNKLCFDGLKKRYGENPDKSIVDRLNYEISIITQMGFVDYYLIVYDFIRYAKENDIPVGPGRGSGAGSVAAYCVGITGVDPIKYNLLFERFLNPERVSMPDFDVDFCNERREDVINYVKRKYSSDHVANIITFGTMAARAAIRDVGRATGVPYSICDSVAKLIPREIGITITSALTKNSDLKALYDNDDTIKSLINMAKKVEGMPRNASTHAAGVVITREPTDFYVPLSKNDEIIVTQYPWTTVDQLGLLKVDFLGLRNLTVIADTVTQLRKRGVEINIDKIPIDDPKVFEMLSQGRTQGVFQFESAGMVRVLSQLKPTSVEDLIAVISLYRPGPMESIPKYLKNSHNPSGITYKHELLRPILDVTYGCIVYQEQVMQICRQLANFSYGHADLLRRAMSKKKASVMEKERKSFVEGAFKNGVSERVANVIYDEMSNFASYAFNKSHAACYAIVAYQTAFLKCHFEKEYMAALLTSVLDSTDKITEYIAECVKDNIKVFPPDVRYSKYGFTVFEDGIRFGLLAVKNIGRSFIDEMTKERELNGVFTDVYNFLERMSGKDLSKRALESLIKCGALDSFSYNRRELLASSEILLESISQFNKISSGDQLSLFADATDVIQNNRIEIVKLDEFSTKELLKMEKDVTGLYLSGHPVNDFTILQKRHNCPKISDIISAGEDLQTPFKDGKKITLIAVISSVVNKITKSSETMSFVTVEDMYGAIEMLVFPKLVRSVGSIIKENNVLIINGKISMKEDENPKIICENMVLADENMSDSILSKTAKEERKGLYVKLESETSESLVDIKTTLKKFSGNSPVYIYFKDIKKLVLFSSDYRVDYNDDLIKELKTIAGEQNIALKI